MQLWGKLTSTSGKTHGDRSITVRVNPDVAKAYRDADADLRNQIDLILDLRLREAFESSESLQTLMREIGRKARDRGLTPEILESILK
jgi:hypothetical protein